MSPRTLELPFVLQAQGCAGRVAVADAAGVHTYDALLAASGRVAAALLQGRQDLAEARIAFLVVPGFAWVATLWGIWRAGGVAVPLALSAARPELEYALADTAAEALLWDEANAETAAPLAAALHLRGGGFEQLVGAEPPEALPAVAEGRRAMILYTSGTTSRPKGVVTTHANLQAQITSLIAAWEWTADDRTVLCLPLHHVHGIVNVVSCALWAGARVEMLAKFDAVGIWQRMQRGELTLFMAVPTIYVRLIAAWEAADEATRQAWSAAAHRLRLMVSGSAALPVSTLERWRELTGQTLLERYGMTEIGMALSNPLHGERRAGSVGMPLPGVQVRLAAEDGSAVLSEGTPGEIEVRGANVFLEYWRRAEATQEAFRDGWFRTGDTAVVEDGRYRILGRTSIDILKTGGHKVSALEIEEVLREHQSIAECAVVGLPDAEWGERICAVVVLHPGQQLELDALRGWGRERLTAHKLPTRLLVLPQLPRNAMGKVVKPEVTRLVVAAEDTGR
ncbi:MAG: acyl-CoA synthetase [Acidobacteriota bacterium]|nr:acyl-CoA synthetase [Acidobacteriota bacterium]